MLNIGEINIFLQVSLFPLCAFIYNHEKIDLIIYFNKSLTIRYTMSESNQTTILTSFGGIVSIIMSITDWAMRDWWARDAIKNFEKDTFELDMSYNNDEEEDEDWGQFIIIDE